MPKAPKPPKVPKVKEAAKKKGKKAKDGGPPPKPSSLAALESHAKDILSKMDQPKKGKVSWTPAYGLLLVSDMVPSSPVFCEWWLGEKKYSFQRIQHLDLWPSHIGPCKNSTYRRFGNL